MTFHVKMLCLAILFIAGNCLLSGAMAGDYKVELILSG